MKESIHLQLLATQPYSSVISDNGVEINTPTRRLKYKTKNKALVEAFGNIFDQKKSLHAAIQLLTERDPDQLRSLFLVLKRLYQENGIAIFYHLDQIHAGTILPMAPMPLITDFSPLSGTIGLARSAKLHRHQEVLVLEAPLARARLEIQQTALVVKISQWMAQATVKVEESLLAQLLVATNLGDLITGDNPLLSKPAPELDGWGSHELFFQFRSRHGFHTYPSGALFLAAGHREPPPANRIRSESEKRIPLNKPKSIKSGTLESVIAARVSTSSYRNEQPALNQLSELLWRTMRQTGEFSMTIEDKTGKSHIFPLKSRPVPSGGSVHEIDAYLLVNAPGSLQKGLWRYDDKNHELVMVTTLNNDTELILLHGQISAGLEKLPPMMLIFSARFDRMMWKYSALPLAAILKHVGVLYEIFYLVATDMRLGVRGLGSGESRAFSQAIQVHPAVESSVGEMLIGLPAQHIA